MVSDQPAKTQLRRQLLDRRAALTAPDRALAAERLTAHVLDWYDSRRITRPGFATVISFGAEPDTGPLRTALFNRGVEVYVPITNRADGTMSWIAWTPQLQLGPASPSGLREPVITDPARQPVYGPEIIDRLEVIHVPALAANARGYRLGYGGGFYDRFLEGLPDSLPVAFTALYDHEFLTGPEDPTIPVEPHDLAVDLIITPSTGVVSRVDEQATMMDGLIDQ